MKIILLLSIFLLTGGCSLTLPVKGSIGNGEITCTGTATGYIDSSGDLQISCTDGLTCTGNFVYITSRYGRGTATCSDGNTGSYDFVSTGQDGTGNGVIGGKPFTFVFGEKMAK